MAAPGDTIHIRLTATYSRTVPFVIESQDQPMLDLFVSDQISGKTFVAWSAQHPNQMEYRIEWKPGVLRVLELDWTATQAEFGRQIAVVGTLRDGPKVVQSAGFVTPPVGTSGGQ